MVAAESASGRLSLSVLGSADDGNVWVATQTGGYPPVGTPSYVATNSFFTVVAGRCSGYGVFAGLLRFHLQVAAFEDSLPELQLVVSYTLP